MPNARRSTICGCAERSTVAGACVNGLRSVYIAGYALTGVASGIHGCDQRQQRTPVRRGLSRVAFEYPLEFGNHGVVLGCLLITEVLQVLYLPREREPCSRNQTINSTNSKIRIALVHPRIIVASISPPTLPLCRNLARNPLLRS